MIEFQRLKRTPFIALSIIIIIISSVAFLSRTKRGDPDPSGAPDDAKCLFNSESYLSTSLIPPGPCGEGEDGKLVSLKSLIKNDVCSQKLTRPDYEASSYTYDLPDLLLSRGTGTFIYDWESEYAKQVLEATYVCPKHAREFGYQWVETHSPKFKKMYKRKMEFFCQVNTIDGLQELQPQHTSPVRITGRVYRINKRQSEAVLDKRNVLVPVGMPLCINHATTVRGILKEFTEKEKNKVEEKPQQAEDKEEKGGRVLRKHVSRRYRYPCSQSHIQCSPSHVHGKGRPQSPEDIFLPPPARCSKEERTEFEKKVVKVQEGLRNFAKEAGFEHYLRLTPVGSDWSELKPDTIHKKVRTAKQLIQLIHLSYAPECPAEFEELVLDTETKRFWKGEVPKVLDEMARHAAELFISANSTNEQKAILSFVTPPLSYFQLCQYIPGLSSYMFKEARRWRRLYGSDILCAVQKIAVPSVKDEQWYMKVEAFVSYLVSPFVVVDLPYGELTLKTSDGKITIPRTVRAMKASRIVDNYISFLEQNDEEHLMLSRSTLFNIISWCTARYSKALAGLDYYSESAGEAFEKLSDLTSELAAKTEGAEDWGKETITALMESKQYLRLEYRMHLKKNSKISDHCFQHALSDPDDPDYAAECEAHVHDDNSLTCSNCNRLINTLGDIGDMLNNAVYAEESKKNEDLWFYERAIEDIMKYKAHLVRTTYNDLAKKGILDNMDENTVFITLDWAMKYLPAKAREGQSNWFGKRGISWHIAVAILKIDADTFLKRTIVHVFDQSKQSSSDVTAIVRHALKVIHEEQPHVTGAIIRSDNAGCYKSTNTIVTMADFVREEKILVKRWIFSEPQSGKGPADRAAARIKRRMNTWLNEKSVPQPGQPTVKHDITNANEFLIAASSFHGLRDVSIFTGTINEDGPAPRSPGGSIPGITKLFDFHLDPRLTLPAYDTYHVQLHVYRMPTLGRGKTISNDIRGAYPNRINKSYFVVSEERHEAEKERKEDYSYWKPVGQTSRLRKKQKEAEKENEDGYRPPDELDDHDDEDEEEAAGQQKKDGCEKPIKMNLFHCPHDGCIKQYQYKGNLDRHLDIGKHVYRPVRESTQDISQRLFAQKLEEIHTSPLFPELNDELDVVELKTSRCQARMEVLPEAFTDQNLLLRRGWALQQASTHVRFNPNQISFLNMLFDEGKRTNKKSNPKEVAKSMPKAVNDEAAQLRFEPSEYLTATQIMSYFSRRAALDRKKEESDKKDDEEDERDVETPDPFASPDRKRPCPEVEGIQPTPSIDEVASNDPQLESEDPVDCGGFEYARRDQYMDDENFDSDEDIIRASFKSESPSQP